MCYGEMSGAPDIFNRTRLLVGDDALADIAARRVAVFGVGGVGSWCAECLVRSGISHLTIVDPDCVAASNINRQLMATASTIGEVKVDVLRRRLLDINPAADIVAIHDAFSDDNAGRFQLDSYHYIIDAIDSLKDKASLILRACQTPAVLFSSMGAALKMDPTRIGVAEFWKVKGCPLGAALRRRFRHGGLMPAKKFLCVYSDELLHNKGTTDETCDYKACVNGSLAHITGIFGLTLAGLVIRDICRY